MALAIPQLKMDPTERRFVVWMAIGALFVFALVAGDYLTSGPIW
jgi:hypothetical protein